MKTETKIQQVVKNNRLVSERVKELQNNGFTCAEKPMGSGGLLQERIVAGERRIQIGYGHGKHNYAMCVIL